MTARADALARAVANHRRTGAALALAYFAAVAALGLRFHCMSDGEAESDFFGAYVLQARAFVSGRVVIDAYRGPLYPAVLGVLGVVLRPLGAGLFETGIVLSALSAALAVFLHHRLVRRIFSPAVALASTLLLVVNPVFFRYSYTAGTDMFFVAVSMTVLWLVLGRETVRRARVVAVGVALALAYLTRYNGAVFVAAAAFAVVALDVWGFPPKRRWAAAAAFAAIFVLAIAPWGIHCQIEKGSFFYNENYRNVAYSVLPAGSTTELAAPASFDELHGMLDVLRAFPRELIGSVPARAYRQFVSTIGGVMRWPVGAAVILGLVSLAVRRSSRRQVAYYAFALAFFAALLPVFYGDRFGLLLIPTWATIAARGLGVVLGIAGGGAWARVAGSAVVVGLVAYSATACVGYNRGVMPGGDMRVRRMAEWLVRNVPPHERGTRVVARKPEFAYFAGLEPVPLPLVESHDELLDYLRRERADYLFFSYVAAMTRPQIAYLLGPQRPQRGLGVVLSSKAAVLYRVNPVGADSSSVTP